MYMIKEKLDSLLKKKNYGCNFLGKYVGIFHVQRCRSNYSCFKGEYRKVKRICGDNWTLTDDVENKIKKVGSFLGNVANQIVSSQTGVDVKNAADLVQKNILGD